MNYEIFISYTNQEPDKQIAQKLVAVAKNMGALSVNFEYQLLLKKPDLVRQLKEVVPAILAYTVNDTNTAKVLFDFGVDGVFSDNPKLLL